MNEYAAFLLVLALNAGAICVALLAFSLRRSSAGAVTCFVVALLLCLLAFAVPFPDSPKEPACAPVR